MRCVFKKLFRVLWTFFIKQLARSIRKHSLPLFVSSQSLHVCGEYLSKVKEEHKITYTEPFSENEAKKTLKVQQSVSLLINNVRIRVRYSRMVTSQM